MILLPLFIGVAEPYGWPGVLAYVDPGTGSYLFQILIAGFTALIFLFRRPAKQTDKQTAASGATSHDGYVFPPLPVITASATVIPEPSSFRDPSGYLVKVDSRVLRVVNACYRVHYERLFASGLYAELVTQKLLLPHREVTATLPGIAAYKVLEPRQLSFISYPYEWSFHQLKDAALATLRIQKLALGYGMSLKDASAFNIQFVDGQPILIDTLSFEIVPAGKPWAAYRQFCQHFLAPLALMRYRDPRMGWMSRLSLDGVPLELAGRLLPHRSWLNPGLFLHVCLHGATGTRLAPQRWRRGLARRKCSRNALHGVVQSLETTVLRLERPPGRSGWGGYYDDDAVTGAQYLAAKERLVAAQLDLAKPATVWDLGANTGRFSRLAVERRIPTLAFDADHDSVDLNYLQACKEQDRCLLPLCVDLTNPSPALGWENRERMAWLQRGHPELVMALALVHHLAIGQNLPLSCLADFFCRMAPWLIVEFVPKADAKAQTLLALREDIFSRYTQADFEQEFGRCFHLEQVAPIPGSLRTLYLMRRRDSPAA